MSDVPLTTNMHYTAVITTCHRQDFLRRALRSALLQTLPANQILIVDDGAQIECVQKIAEECSQEARRRKLHCPKPEVLANKGLGISAARNSAIRQAGSEWIAFLDDDDEWHPDKMRRQADAVSAQHSKRNYRPHYRMCHTNEIWLRQGQILNQQNKHQKSGGYLYMRCLPLCCISPSSALMHRTLFADYGMFDEKLIVCEDYDMWLRICAYEEVAYVPDALVTKHGGHSDQLSQKYPAMDRFRIRALIKMMQDERLATDKREATRQMLLQKLDILAAGAKKRSKRRPYLLYRDCHRYWSNRERQDKHPMDDSVHQSERTPEPWRK